MAVAAIEMGPGVTLWKPDTDALHVNPVVPQDEPAESVYLGLPLGECGGVLMANQAMDALAEEGTGPIYGNHEPTHGADATAQHEAMGAVFGLTPDEVPEGSIYLISAHGAEPGVRKRAEERRLRVFDVTCPLVTHTHNAIERAGPEGHVAYISFGSPGHAERVGSAGLAQARGVGFTVLDSEAAIVRVLEEAGERPISVVGQSTNNSDAAIELAEELRRQAEAAGQTVRRGGAHDVCHTVRDRQAATRAIVHQGVDTLVVVGAVKSKNTGSLAKVGAEEAVRAGSPLEIRLANSWGQLPKILGRVGIVSGASTFERNVWGVVDRLAPVRGVTTVGEDTDGGIVFKPKHGPTRRLLSI